MKRRFPVIAIIAVGAALALAGTIWFAAQRQAPGHTRIRLTEAVPPLPALPDDRREQLTPEQAMAANAAKPASLLPVEPARPFTALKAKDFAIQRISAADCLTAALYYEAASEGDDGQRAVAQVVLNRLRHPAFPKSVCGVVFQGSERRTGCQFSFTCDGSLGRRPVKAIWDRARRIADQALDGKVFQPVGMSTHYHTIWILPYWASSLTKVRTIGAHIFYRWQGYWGQRSAFSGRYLGAEPALTTTMDGRTLLAGAGLDGLEQLLSPGEGDAEAALAGDPTANRSSLPSTRVTVPDLPPIFEGPRPLADQTRGALSADENLGSLINPGTDQLGK